VTQSPEPTQGRPIEILLVEDSPSDIRITQEHLQRSKIRNNLVVVEDGREALVYLRAEGAHVGRSWPDLILLDIKLPGLDGHQVLARIKADPELKRIPVVVMTGSDEEADIVRAYERHANCYVTKPVSLEQFARVVRTIEDFWFTIVKLPPGGGSR
jgi:two-component system, chemotaxis family, response regulator Rcp1